MYALVQFKNALTLCMLSCFEGFSYYFYFYVSIQTNVVLQ
jgi:hypothetical protein